MSLLAQAVTWCDVTQAVASVVIALSSIVAICVAVKHWRDDDPHLAFVAVKKPFDDGTYRYRYSIRIINAGRYPVHFRNFIVRNGYPTAVNLGTYSYPENGERLIAPGAFINVVAIIVTEHENVTFPETAEIWCETAAAKLVYVARIDFSDDCPAAEAKRLATVSKLDGVLDNRIGHAPGYK